MSELGEPPAIARAWAYHEALRRLGFPAEHLFVQVAVDAVTRRPALFVLLLPNGMTEGVANPGPRFTIGAGDAPERAGEQWRAWAKSLPTIPKETLETIWYSVFPTEETIGELVSALLRAGFSIPALGIENEPAHFVDAATEAGKSGRAVCGKPGPLRFTQDPSLARCHECRAKIGN